MFFHLIHSSTRIDFHCYVLCSTSISFFCLFDLVDSSPCVDLSQHQSLADSIAIIAFPARYFTYVVVDLTLACVFFRIYVNLHYLVDVPEIAIVFFFSLS